MDLDVILRVDRCRDMDELVNFWPDPDHSEPDCFLRYRMNCNAEFYYVGKIPRTGIEHGYSARRVVLRRRNTVVGGKCDLPSAF